MVRKLFAGVVAALALAAGSTSALAQVGTAITYQGQLKESGSSTNAPVDLEFRLFDALTGGAQVGTTVTATLTPVDGLFTRNLDFGVNPYVSGVPSFLEVKVASAGSGVFATLPRQRLTAAPFSAATRGINVSAGGAASVATLRVGSNVLDDGTLVRPLIVKRNPLQDIYMSFQDDDSAVNEWEWRGDSAAGLSLWAGFDQRVTFQPDGNVGIGTTAPFNRLDVAAGSTIGPSAIDGFEFNDPTNRGAKVGFGYHTPADGCGPDNFRGMRVDVVPGTRFCGNSTDITFWTDECNTSCPRSVMVIEGSGNVGIGSAANGFKLNVNGDILCTTLTQTSSRDFKENIVPLTSALDSIMKLNGVSYNWNGKAPEQVQGHRDIGFIADEVNEVLPDIVAKDASGKPIGIDYGKVTPVAVEAIKQLKNENDQLKARLEKIEAMLAAQAAGAGHTK
ncbi:MAG: tail fiber domain-containing protein [Phycisphaerales bacterium]